MSARAGAIKRRAEEIKGWMTLGDVAQAYNVPVEEIVKQFGLPASTGAETQIKSLEGGTFTTTALRTWLAERVKQ